MERTLFEHLVTNVDGRLSTVTETKKSKGHLFFKDGYEWYLLGDQVYRAPLNNVFDIDTGARIGRWEYKKSQIDWLKKNKIYPFDESEKTYQEAYPSSKEDWENERDTAEEQLADEDDPQKRAKLQAQRSKAKEMLNKMKEGKVYAWETAYAVARAFEKLGHETYVGRVRSAANPPTAQMNIDRKEYLLTIHLSGGGLSLEPHHPDFNKLPRDLFKENLEEGLFGKSRDAKEREAADARREEEQRQKKEKDATIALAAKKLQNVPTDEMGLFKAPQEVNGLWFIRSNDPYPSPDRAHAMRKADLYRKDNTSEWRKAQKAVAKGALAGTLEAAVKEGALGYRCEYLEETTKYSGEGPWKMTMGQCTAIHKDHKGKVDGKRMATTLDPKTGATVLVPVEIIKESSLDKTDAESLVSHLERMKWKSRVTRKDSDTAYLYATKDISAEGDLMKAIQHAISKWAMSSYLDIEVYQAGHSAVNIKVS